MATSSDSTAGASAIVFRGNVTTHGRLAKGVSVFTGSLGAATVHLEDGTVTTLGYEGVGLSIEAGAVFSASGGGGNMTIAGDVTNRGTSVLSVQDGNTGDVITIGGDYVGSGASVFALDTVLEGAGFATDTLVITGAMGS